MREKQKVFDNLQSYLTGSSLIKLINLIYQIQYKIEKTQFSEANIPIFRFFLTLCLMKI